MHLIIGPTTTTQSNNRHVWQLSQGETSFALSFTYNNALNIDLMFMNNCSARFHSPWPHTWLPAVAHQALMNAFLSVEPTARATAASHPPITCLLPDAALAT